MYFNVQFTIFIISNIYLTTICILLNYVTNKHVADTTYNYYSYRATIHKTKYTQNDLRSISLQVFASQCYNVFNELWYLSDWSSRVLEEVRALLRE